MQRKRLWTLATALLLAAGMLYLLLSSLIVHAVQTSTSHTTVEDFNPGTFYHTGLTKQNDGEVALLRIGIAGEWTSPTVQGLPPVYGHAMVEHNGYVYVLGGRTGTDGFVPVLTRTVFMSRINTTTYVLGPFTPTTPLPLSAYPFGVYMHSAVVVSDHLYVIGGDINSSNVPTNTVMYATFNEDGGLSQWEYAPSLPDLRSRVPAVVLNNYIYVPGGKDDSGGGQAATGSVLYAPTDSSGLITGWVTATANLPYSPMGQMTAAYGGRVYVIGGYDYSHDTVQPWVHFATPSTKTGDIELGGWISTTGMFQPIMGGVALAFNGQLFTLGGIESWGGNPVGWARSALLDINSGHVITFAAGEGWYRSPALSPDRVWHAAVASHDNRYVYVLGGTQGSVDPLSVGMLNIGSTTGEGGESGYASSGWYIGPTIELGSDRKVLNFNWTTFLPTPTVTMTLQYRTQGLSGGWSEWSAPIPPSGTIGMITTTVPFTDVRAFRFQYRAWLTTTDQLHYTPYLNRFELVYDVPAQPDFRKEADPPTGVVLQGQRITYTLSFTTSSQDQSPIRDVLITDTLPAYLAYVPGSITATAGITTDDSLLPELRWYVGTLPPGSKGQVGFVAVVSSTAPPGTQLINRGRFRSPDTRDVDKFTIHSVGELHAPLLTKTAVPASGAWVPAGQAISYTLTVSNPNSTFPLDVTITDTLPPSTTFQSGSCAPACTLVDRELRWTITVAPLAQGYVRFGAVVVQDAPNGTVIANTGYGVGCVTAAGACADSVSSNSTTHHVTDLLPPAMDKQAVPASGSTVYPGARISYTLVYSNPDLVPLTDVTITDTLPPDMQFVAGSCTPACIANSGTLTWTVGPLSPGQGGQVSFAVLVSGEAVSGTALVNTGYTFGCVASAGKCSGVGASNSTMHIVMVQGETGQISKSANPPGGPAANQSVPPGSLITYTLTYTNPNPSASLARVVIKDVLPANTTLVSCVGCITSTYAVSWTFSSVGPNVSGQVQFIVRVDPSAPDGTVIQNQASITSDQGRANSNATSHRVLTRYDLQLTKTVNMTATVPGSTFVYGVAYTNSGPLTLTGVVITDYLGFAPQGQASAPAMPYLVVLDKSPAWQWVQASSMGSIYQYDVGTLYPNQTGVLTMVIQLYNTVPYTVNLMNNHALITDDGLHGYDMNPSNQAPDVSTPIQGPDLVITAPRISPGPYRPGKVITVTATIVNRGLGDALTWDHPITPTNNWFFVELYARPSSFAQSGPPTGVYDHAGGFCDNEDITVCMQNASHQRKEFTRWGNLYRLPLQPGGSTVVTWSVSLAAADVYSLYLQVDTGSWQPLDPPYGRVLEYDEMNNVVSLGQLSTGKRVYLPLIVRR